MTLPSAVPPYLPDVAALHQRIGELSSYQLQLMDTLRERAIEANALHDRVLELEAQVKVLEDQTRDMGYELLAHEAFDMED